tara:strand:- start:4796 stop:6736 length:1941 start_codon:yes stop_codon:yes gene_type:complete
MGIISERITNTIEDWTQQWSDRLKAFLTYVIGFGIEVIMDVVAQKAAPTLKPMIDKMRETGAVPPELEPLLGELENPTGEWAAVLGQSAGGAAVGGAVGRVLDGLLNPLAYGIHQLTKTVRLSQNELLGAWYRKDVSDDDLTKYLEQYGLSPQMQTALKVLAQARLNPEIVARLWLRDKERFEVYWEDLREQGVTEDRIDAFKELAYAVPSPQDVVLFMGREAFEEESVVKYGLDDEFEGLDLKWFERAGVTPEVAKLFWRSHWQHPALATIFDLLHRGEITDADVYEYYRLVEIPPHWRDKLTNISWDLPNRIELRMMSRFGLVDKPFLIEQLKKVGLAEEYRDIAADMMLVMGIRTDLSTRYSKGWLDAAGVQAAITEAGLSEEIGQKLYQWIVKNTAAERVAKERDLTLSDIYKGIKKGTLTRVQGAELIKDMGYDDFEVNVKLTNNVPIEETVVELKERELTKADILRLYRENQIDNAEALSRLMGIRYNAIDSNLLLTLIDATRTVISDERQRELTKIDIVKGVKADYITPEEGYMMLLDVGYKPDDAGFILAVRAEVIAGSPNTFGEFKKMTQEYRASQGQEFAEVSEERIAKERAVKIAEAALKQGRIKELKAERITELEEAVEEAKIAYHQLPKASTP